MEFIKKVRNEISSLGCDVAVELQNNHKKYNKAAGFGAFLASSLYTVIPMFASTDIAGFGSNIKDVISKIYTAAFPIVTVLAALMLVIAIIMRMAGGQQTAQKATSWIVRIIVCYVAVNCIGLLFSVIENTTSTYTYTVS